MKKHGQIELYQLFFLLVHVQIGVSVVTLPYDIHLVAKGDSWISLLLTGIIIQIIILLFAILIKRYPNDHFFQITEKVFGKWIGKIISLIYTLYFISLGVFILNKYALIISAWMMPLTPSWILISLVVLVSLYMVTAELPIIARFFVLVSLVFAIYISFGIYSLKDANVTYILPIGHAGGKDVVKGVYPAILSFVGFGTLLTFAAFTNGKPKQKIKVASIANAFVTFIYIFIVLVTMLTLSPDEIVLVPEPVLYIVKSFTFKVIERPDLLFTSIWVVLVITSYVLFIYVASIGMQETFKMNKRTTATYLCVLASSVISISFKGTYILIIFTNIFEVITLIFSIIIPVCIVLYVLIFDKRSKESE